jgi:hypothetical protein
VAPSWLRRGTWHPTRGTWIAPLLTIQLLGLGQALLRGADYVRSPGIVPELITLTPPPLWLWGMVLGASAVAGLVGIVGHWGTVVAVGHCGVALVYLCVGVALLNAEHVTSWPRAAAGLAVLVAGAVVARIRPADPTRFVLTRLAAVGLLVAGTLGVIDGMGTGYRHATGQLTGAAIHGVLGLSILRIVQRQRIRARLQEEG